MNGIIAVDKNLNSSMIREVKSERRMCRGLPGSPKDFANDFAGVDTGTGFDGCKSTVQHKTHPRWLSRSACGRLRAAVGGEEDAVEGVERGEQEVMRSERKK